MKKIVTIIGVIFFSISLSAQKFSYKYDNDLKILYYEKVLSFPNIDSNKLEKKIKQFFEFYKISGFRKEDNNIFGLSQGDAVYKGWFLFIGHSTAYTCFYDVKISIKSDKIKYYLYNFILVPKKIAVNSTSWFGNSGSFGSFGVSTQRIPTSVPKKHLELFYNEKKFQRRHKIFYTVENNVLDFETKLTNYINKEEKDW